MSSLPNVPPQRRGEHTIGVLQAAPHIEEILVLMAPGHRDSSIAAAERREEEPGDVVPDGVELDALSVG